MSENARWSYTAEATVWSYQGSDVEDVPAYSAPVAFRCSWVFGGATDVDDAGKEFKPSLTLFTERQGVKREDMIATGNHITVTDPIDANANVVRSVKEFDETLFNDIPDYEIKTAGNAG